MPRFFFSLGPHRLARLLKCSLFDIILIGPGVGVGVGVDQEPGVGAGVGVGTAPPRLRTPGINDEKMRSRSRHFLPGAGTGALRTFYLEPELEPEPSKIFTALHP